MAYDKSGRSSDGSLDPLRSLVAGIMHVGSGGSGGASTRQIADDLYQTMSTGQPHGGWSVKTAKGGGDGDNSGNGGKKDDTEDIDFPIKTRSRSLTDTYRPKVKPTMNEGGLVRGAGCAQRGRGRGKMV